MHVFTKKKGYNNLSRTTYRISEVNGPFIAYHDDITPGQSRLKMQVQTYDW